MKKNPFVGGMLPLALNPAKVRIGLAGAGQPASRRLAALRAAGVEPAMFAADAALACEPAALPFPPSPAALASLHVLYVTGLEAAQYSPLAETARAAKILLNVEDVPAFCDFSSVAEIRRGDLLLTVSTGGAAPGLAGTIRRALEGCFAQRWDGHVAEIAALRQGWRAEQVPMAEAAQRIDIIVRERGWLSCPKPD